MPHKNNKILLEKFFNNNNNNIIDEIGIDEAGRGPMFGRVYSACVILPKNDDFKYEMLKDSKKFTSKKKLLETYEYIIQNAIAYSVSWEDEKTIDTDNILVSTHKCMHKSINNIIEKMNIIYNINTTNYNEKYYILVDGNNFKNYTYYNNITNQIESINHICIEGGDNKYCSIAAASIIAKVERDKYIEELCNVNKILVEYYDILNNKGYGTKKHIDGIQKYGLTNMHRKSFGICKNININHTIFIQDE